jgi:hypothetical protein
MFFEVCDVTLTPVTSPYAAIQIETSDEKYEQVRTVLKALESLYRIPVTLVSENSGSYLQNFYEYHNQPIPKEDSDIKTCVQGVVRYKNVMILDACRINCFRTDQLNALAQEVAQKFKELQVGSVAIRPLPSKEVR